MENLTFNELPKAVSDLSKKLDRIEELILQNANGQSTEQDELLTVKDAAKFLNLSVATIYGLTSKGELPRMKRSKRCYFLKSDLIEYLKQGKIKTNAEIDQAAQNYINKKS